MRALPGRGAPRDRRLAPPPGRALGGEGRPRSLRPLVGPAALALVVAAVAGCVVGNDGGGGSGAPETVVSGQPPGVIAKMVSDGEGGSLQLCNVKELPEGKVLEAWVQREGEVEAVPAPFASPTAAVRRPRRSPT